MVNLDEFVGECVAEGVVDAVNEVAGVLAMGKDKYEPQHWRNQCYEHQLEKLEGHLIRVGREDESGRMHLAHTIARALFALQIELEEES